MKLTPRYLAAYAVPRLGLRDALLRLIRLNLLSCLYRGGGK